MSNYPEAGKGDKTRPTTNQRMAEANMEIYYGGWKPLEIDRPGTGSYEVQRFHNNHDPSIAKPYWRPLGRAVVGTWKCECGDEVPESYPECPICEFKKESK